MKESEWSTLDIRIFGADDSGYPVEFSLGEQQFPRGVMPREVAEWTAIDPRAADGARLLALLLADRRLRDAWVAVASRYPRRRLRLRLDEGASELAGVPWESLQDPDVRSAACNLAADADTPFSRHVSAPMDPPPPVEGPPRVLVAVADASNLSHYELAPIDAERERALVREAFTAGPVDALASPCTLSAVIDALQRDYHVLHLVAHGAFNRQRGRGALFLADAQGRVDIVDELELAEAVRRISGELRLVVLIACESAARGSRDALQGVAARLTAAGVPAVVAMQDRVAVSTAHDFVRAFYRALGEHGLVDLAANLGRAAVMTAELPGAAIPVLFSRLADARLFVRGPGRPVAREQPGEAPAAVLFTGDGFMGEAWRAPLGAYDTHQLPLGNDRIRSARVPAGLRLRVYGDIGFTGCVEIVDADAPTLLLADDVSGVRVEPHVVALHPLPDFAGAPRALGLGEHPWPAGASIASVRVPSGLRLRLCAGAVELAVCALDTSQLALSAPPDVVVVERHAVRLYEFPDYQGRSQVLGIGRHDLDSLALGNDVAASIRIPEGLTATLFKHAGFGGSRVELSADAPEISIGVSSLIVAPTRRAR